MTSCTTNVGSMAATRVTGIYWAMHDVYHQKEHSEAPKRKDSGSGREAAARGGRGADKMLPANQLTQSPERIQVV